MSAGAAALRVDPGAAYAVPGLTLGSAAAGLRAGTQGHDLALLAWEPGAAIDAVFTRNACHAAPVEVARRHLRAREAKRCCLINSAIANAGTGAAGIRDCMQTCAGLAERMNCPPQAVLPFSTGVIGERLPLERFLQALPGLTGSLRADGWEAAARAILTTDNGPKLCRAEWRAEDGNPIRMTGMAKGAGMIRPDMATMLAFLATDADVEQRLLGACLRQAVDDSFNCITVDGECSTNDAVVLIATGRGPRIDARGADGERFTRALQRLCRVLADMIVRDGEGATRTMEVRVTGGRDRAECMQVAYRIADSPLVKTALHAADPNWGRILAAAGAAGVPGLGAGDLCIAIGGVPVYRDGAACAADEAALRAHMSGACCHITVGLGRGEAEATVLGCDLSRDYVRINADRRS